MTKHSPLPFKIGPLDTREIRDESDADIAMTLDTYVGPDVSDANAHFIVRACNNHYRLLEACKALIHAFITERCAPMNNEQCNAEIYAMNAIAKAEAPNAQ